MHNYFQHKRVVVTGGAGFIGSHLSEQLIANGAHVTIVDSLLTGHRQNVANLKVDFIEVDIGAKPAEEYFPSGYVPDVILHFASPASPPKYQKYPIETYSVNSFGTHYLLQYLLKVNPQARFLFASTSEVYGDPLVHPQPESYWGNVNPNGPRSLYDEAKRLGETICGVHTSLGMDVRIVRIFNTFGPRIDILDGRVIPNFLKQALQKEPLTIYGDGSQTRSYCYVSDLVEGILRFASHPDLGGETINLGNPEERTILETAEVIQSLLSGDTPLPIEFEPLPIDDPQRRQPDISKAQKLLGWQPEVSFEEGLLRTIKYFRENKI